MQNWPGHSFGLYRAFGLFAMWYALKIAIFRYLALFGAELGPKDASGQKSLIFDPTDFFSLFFLNNSARIVFRAEFSQESTAQSSELANCVIFRLWEEICNASASFSFKKGTQLAKTRWPTTSNMTPAFWIRSADIKNPVFAVRHALPASVR